MYVSLARPCFSFFHPAIVLTPSAGAAYLRALDRSPLISKMFTSGTLVVLGDGISQTLIERREKYDFARTLRMFAFGFCISGPAMHAWYGFLSARISGTGFQKGIKVYDELLFFSLFRPPWLGFLRGR
jgi:protein Mpv17